MLNSDGHKRVLKLFQAWTGKKPNIACLLLNHHGNRQCLPFVLDTLWCQSRLKVCVDGGAEDLLSVLAARNPVEQWLDGTNGNELPRELGLNGDRDKFDRKAANVHIPHSAKPDIVCGDFDSVRRSTLAMYEAMGVLIRETPDQNDTDFAKAMKVISEERDLTQIDEIYVVCPLSGRIDHTLAILNTLYSAEKYVGNVPVFLLSDVDISFVLKPEDGTTLVDARCQLANTHCGVIPIGGRSEVWTKGLAWDMSGLELCFGEMISSSNQIQEEKVFEIRVEGSSVMVTIGHDLVAVPPNSS